MNAVARSTGCLPTRALGRARLVSTWVSLASPCWGKVLFCVLIWERWGTLGKTNWFPNLDKQKGCWTCFFAKTSCFSKRQEECLLTVTTQTMKNAGGQNKNCLDTFFLPQSSRSDPELMNSVSYVETLPYISSAYTSIDTST